ncbi:MAG: TonB-dependent receptor, partial [Hyphomonadaceae bacterium]
GSIVRGSLLFQPRQDLEILLRAEWYQNEGDPTTVRGVAPGLAANSQPFQDGYRTPANFFAAAPNDRGYNDSDVYMAVLEANWDVGGGTLTFINGIREIRERGFTDYDGLPGTYFHTRGDYNQNQSSSELRYAMQLNDRIGFTLGAYYFESQWISGQNRELSRSTQFLATESRQEQDSFAFFAEGDWNITDRLTLTLGARYTEETKTAATAPFGSCNFDITNCVYGAPDSVSDDDVTPRVALAYELSDNHLLYGSVTRGFRSGGFALRGVPLISPYASEQVTAYEIGSKNDFFDNRLRVNVAGYVNNFTDLQRTTVATDPVAGIVQSTFNAAEATIQGLEVEVDAHVTNNLLLQLSYGYIDATYDSFLGVANVTSRAFVRVPENTLGVSAEYSQPLSNDAELAARLSAYYTDSFFYDDANTLQQDAYTLIDASVGYTAPGGDWSVTLWGKNLTEEEYAHWGANLGALGENYFIGRPRTWGVQLSREF